MRRLGHRPPRQHHRRPMEPRQHAGEEILLRRHDQGVRMDVRLRRTVGRIAPTGVLRVVEVRAVRDVSGQASRVSREDGLRVAGRHRRDNGRHGRVHLMPDGGRRRSHVQRLHPPGQRAAQLQGRGGHGDPHRQGGGRHGVLARIDAVRAARHDGGSLPGGNARSVQIDVRGFSGPEEEFDTQRVLRRDDVGTSLLPRHDAAGGLEEPHGESEGGCRDRKTSLQIDIADTQKSFRRGRVFCPLQWLLAVLPSLRRSHSQYVHLCPANS
mmetsp:Transcript_39633/g.80887  ORF Transcript_39633/g.80887 Transcript_39633/m.80887 type:complete len:268 (+) Transcript_39633:307-1110(+)